VKAVGNALNGAKRDIFRLDRGRVHDLAENIHDLAKDSHGHCGWEIAEVALCDAWQGLGAREATRNGVVGQRHGVDESVRHIHQSLYHTDGLRRLDSTKVVLTKGIDSSGRRNFGHSGTKVWSLLYSVR
jgi:hypothetical protein